MCIFTPHISCLMAVYNSVEWDRTSACEGASCCRYQPTFDLTHLPNPCIKSELKLKMDHNTGNYVFDKCVGSLTIPVNHVTLKRQETGPTVTEWLLTLGIEILSAAFSRLNPEVIKEIRYALKLRFLWGAYMPIILGLNWLIRQLKTKS